jgi:hypothetical protein
MNCESEGIWKEDRAAFLSTVPPLVRRSTLIPTAHAELTCLAQKNYFIFLGEPSVESGIA